MMNTRSHEVIVQLGLAVFALVGLAGGVSAASIALGVPVGGEAERGLELLRAGKPKEAAAAFRAAIDVRGPEPELYYNLAVALWRAGDAEAAETAAEQAATLSDGRYGPRRDCLIGNLRFDSSLVAGGDRPDPAMAAPSAANPGSGSAGSALPVPGVGAEPDLQRALQLAEQARTYYERGILAGAERDRVPPELVRNLERALARIEELKERIENQPKDPNKKQDKKDPSESGEDESGEEDDKGESKDGKDDGQQDGEQPNDQRNPDDPQQDQKKSDDQKPEDQQKPGDERQQEPEGQEGKQEPGDQKPNDQKPNDQKPNDQKSRDQDPGEQPPGSGRDGEEPGQTEQAPDPKGEGEDPPPPAPGEPDQQDKPTEANPPGAVPGEADRTKELTPEQTQRLLQQLEKVDEARRRLRQQQRKRRKKVEKDW